MTSVDAASLDAAADALYAARYAIALVGAGISVESGIPPFRGPGGLWTKHGEPPMDGYQRFLANPEGAWRDMLAHRESNDEFAVALRQAVPNEGHLALARLESIGVLKHTITQNIDNLHFDAGSVAVSEIHGNRTKLRCVDCERRRPAADVDVSVLPPVCPDCGGLIKGDTVMFGEPIPRSVLRECQTQAERADCILIAGTSATVTPAAWFPELVLERGGTLIEVNPDATPFSRLAVAGLRAPAGQVLPMLVAAVEARSQQ